MAQVLAQIFADVMATVFALAPRTQEAVVGIVTSILMFFQGVGNVFKMLFEMIGQGA